MHPTTYVTLYFLSPKYMKNKQTSCSYKVHPNLIANIPVHLIILLILIYLLIFFIQYDLHKLNYLCYPKFITKLAPKPLNHTATKNTQALLPDPPL